MQAFEDLIIWQKSRTLVNDIYKAFKDNRDFSFRDQIQRAVISIMNNIAEGFERKGDKEFIRFLNIAIGSCGEVRSMLYLASDLGYLTTEKAAAFRAMCLEIRRLTIRFAWAIRNEPARQSDNGGSASPSNNVRQSERTLRTTRTCGLSFPADQAD
jgi:four helix bundle protein